MLNLRERYQNKLQARREQSECFPKVGDIALIKDDLPRCSRKFGKAVRLQKCSDGLIRSASLNISSGQTLTRPLNLLYPMKTSEHDSTSNTTDKPEVCESTKKRPTRITIEKARQNIKKSDLSDLLQKLAKVCL